MKKIFNVVVVLFALLAVSCTEGDGRNFWGEAKVYSDSWYWHYEPVIMERVLEFEFNEDAMSDPVLKSQTFTFEMYEEDECGRVAPAEHIAVYKNGEACPNNRLAITVEDSVVKVGIQFLDGAKEGEHTLIMRAVDMNSLDRVDNKLGNFYVDKNEVMNPADKGMMWFAIVLGGLYIFWLCFLRPICRPYVKFSRMEITYPDGEEYMIRTSGKTAVILTNPENAKKYRQGFFSALFMTKHLVIVNEVWTSTVTIKSKKGGYHRISGNVGYTPDEPMRREPFTLITDEGARVKVETN